MTKVLFVCWDGLVPEMNIVKIVRSIFSSNRIGDNYSMLNMGDIDYDRCSLEKLLIGLIYDTYGDHVIILVNLKNVDLMINLFTFYVLHMYQHPDDKPIDIRSIFIESSGMKTEEFIEGLLSIKTIEDVKDAIKDFRNRGKVTNVGPLLSTLTAPMMNYHIHQTETLRYDILANGTLTDVDRAMYNFLRWFYEDDKEYIRELDDTYNRTDE